MVTLCEFLYSYVDFHHLITSTKKPMSAMLYLRYHNQCGDDLKLFQVEKTDLWWKDVWVGTKIYGEANFTTMLIQVENVNWLMNKNQSHASWKMMSFLRLQKGVFIERNITPRLKLFCPNNSVYIYWRNSLKPVNGIHIFYFRKFFCLFLCMSAMTI